MADYQSYKKLDGGDSLIANSIGPGQSTGISTGIVCRSFYFNCCNNEPCNGGCCYLWTVPQGVTTIQFEVISGGGSGGPGRCCNSPYNAAGGGAYATKMLYANCGHFTAGSDQYTICAASSSRCSCCGCCNGRLGCGFYGCPSFVLGGGLTDFCVQGGSFAVTQYISNCYSCLKIRQGDACFSRCSAAAPALQTTSDQSNLCNHFTLCGMTGGELKNYDCHSGSWAISSGAVGPWGVNRNFGQTNCTLGNVRGCCYGVSLFPGGGGFGPMVQGGSQCWGDWGNGGLVVVTTWS